MVLVQLSDKDVAYFRGLEAVDPWTHHSVHPDEVSGALVVSPAPGGKYTVKIAELKTGHRTNSATPKGAVTFHTHNVAPGDIFHSNLSTDVPSWQDFRMVALETTLQGLKDHLIFTPNYTYVVSCGPVLLRNLNEQARLSKNSLVTFATAKTQARYTALVNHIGANYGADFIAHWVEEMRGVGFVIEQRREGQTVFFDYTGPLPMSQDVSVGLEPDTQSALNTEMALIVVGSLVMVAFILWVIWKQEN